MANTLPSDVWRLGDSVTPTEKLVESLGHTRMEVVVGLMLGIAVAYLTHQVFPA